MEKQHTILYNSFSEFISTISWNFQRDIVQQIDFMFMDCFNSEWDIDNDMIFVVNFHIIENNPYSMVINGVMSLSHSSILENTLEVYNVCVRKDMRGKQILKKMLDVLPKDKYYILSVLFENYIAYRAYIKYFFCDYVSIGILNCSGPEPLFILGGSPDKPCSWDRNDMIKIMDDISKIIKTINIKKVIKLYMKYPEFFHNLNQVENPILKDKNIKVLLKHKSVFKHICNLLENYRNVFGDKFVIRSS